MGAGFADVAAVVAVELEGAGEGAVDEDVVVEDGAAGGGEEMDPNLTGAALAAALVVGAGVAFTTPLTVGVELSAGVVTGLAPMVRSIDPKLIEAKRAECFVSKEVA